VARSRSDEEGARVVGLSLFLMATVGQLAVNSIVAMVLIAMDEGRALMWLWIETITLVALMFGLAWVTEAWDRVYRRWRSHAS
jgi:hypothetical protein